MSWTLKNYQDRVAALAADQDPTPADIGVWVNTCLRQELQPFANVEGGSNLSVVAGQKEYTLPVDLFELRRVWVRDTAQNETPLNRVPDDDRTTPGFRLWAGKLILQPAPVATEAGNVLVLEYYKRLGRTQDSGALASANDVPNIPLEWHDLPFLYACMRAKQQDSEFGEGRDFAAEYQSRLQQFKTKPDKPVRGARFIRPRSW